MRVIGGELRGRRLAAPDVPSVRPTTDRVREAIFDMLYSLGGVEGLSVADLFAGSGALGIEALSRGASSVTFVDREPASLETIRANLEKVGGAGGVAGVGGVGGFGRVGRVGGVGVGGGTGGTRSPGWEGMGDTKVVRADVDAWVTTTQAHFDLVLCDPPYEYDGWDSLCPRLPGDLVVVESRSPISAWEGWTVIKSKRYGGTIVTVARPVQVSEKGPL